jgi:hypothetical protein
MRPCDAMELCARLCSGCWMRLVPVDYPEFLRLTAAIASAGMQMWLADPIGPPPPTRAELRRAWIIGALSCRLD